MIDPAQIALPLWALLVIGTYKIASLLVGLGLAHMGYRLFLAGIRGPAGEFDASYESGRLKLGRAAPGTFFALFGAAVIAATVYKGFDVEMPGVITGGLKAMQLPPVPENGGATR